MSALKSDFLKHICQTSDSPLGLEIVRGDGPYVFTADGKKYFDLISGIGVVNAGHNQSGIIEAIRQQAGHYLHPMVYGEFILQPQVEYAKKLAAHLPGKIDNIFFSNSGAEAVEGALKTARKYTGRSKILSFAGCYHGDTMGALSCQAEPVYRKPFEPLVPQIFSLQWNSIEGLAAIDEQTAGVIIEPVQAEGGVRIPGVEFMRALRNRCTETGAVLIFDEVMTGFGRTGKLFAAEHFGVNPDLIVLAKALGGGLPLGAFAGPKQIMQTLSENPPFAHVTTFGGNPVCCAAGLAAFEIILRDNLPLQATRIGEQFVKGLKKRQRDFPMIREVRGKGCLIGIEFEKNTQATAFCNNCLKNGLIVGWTLFHSNIVRMAPPLILSENEIASALSILEDQLATLPG
jgi:acetylornithine/succinyldiaminopimelate/putrescine aminotransferase